jgi:hypothetical protein
MVLSVNKVNKQDTNSTQFSYLPIEILNLVNTFVYHKSMSDIKKNELFKLHNSAEIIRHNSLAIEKQRYDETNEFANRLVKRKLVERATELRNRATQSYNNQLQKTQEIYNQDMLYINRIKTIFKGTY